MTARTIRLALRRAAPLLALLYGGHSSATARAGEVHLRARTYGEAYVLRLASDAGAFVPRRRLVQQLDLGVYDLLPPTDPSSLRRRPDEAQLSVVTSMRVRHDFGAYQDAPTVSTQRLVDVVDGRQVDVMFAYVEARRVGGMLDARVGRQFSLRGLDMVAFDGAWLRLQTPSPIALQTFGGLMVRGADVLGYPTYELDGVRATEPGAPVAPLVGAGIELSTLRRGYASVDWRQTFAAGEATDGTPTPRTLESVIAAQAAVYPRSRRASLSGALRVDLGVAQVTDARAQGRIQVTPDHAWVAEYLHVRPVFSMDSIFNVFDLAPVEMLSVRTETRLSAAWRLSAQGSVRLFRAGRDAGEAAARLSSTSQGGAVHASWRAPRLRVQSRVTGFAGEGGDQLSGFLDVAGDLLWGRLTLENRLYVNAVSARARPYGAGWTAASQLIARGRLWQGIHLHWLHEPSLSRQWRWAYRTMLMLSMDWSVRGGRR